MKKPIVILIVAFIAMMIVFGVALANQDTVEKKSISLTEKKEPPYKLNHEMHENANQSIVTKVYDYYYNDAKWHIELSVPVYILENYKDNVYGLYKPQKAFVDDEYLNEVVKQFETQINSNSKQSLAEAIIYFVQTQIVFETDEKQYGREEYWSYPVETLISGKGDSDCKSVLMSAMLNVADLDAIILYHLIGEHNAKLAVLVNGVTSFEVNNNEGVANNVYVIHKGKTYYIVDAVDNLGIGEYPNSYKNEMDTFMQINNDRKCFIYKNTTLVSELGYYERIQA